MNQSERKLFANRIVELARTKRWSFTTLATQADITPRTLLRVRKGEPVSEDTLHALCEALGSSLEEMSRRKLDSQVAAEYLGGYSAKDAARYIGMYRTVRQSFIEKDTIYCHQTEVYWSEELPGLVFEESIRPDGDEFAHSGWITMPAQTAFVYLIAGRAGWQRTVLATRLDRVGRMRGLLLTLQAAGGTMLTPSAQPIVYLKSSPGSVSCGAVRQGDAEYSELRALLVDLVAPEYKHVALLDPNSLAATLKKTS